MSTGRTPRVPRSAAMGAKPARFGGQYENAKKHMTAREVRPADELEHRLRFERLVMSVSTQLINRIAQEIDAGIEQALSLLGSYCRVDRAYVFLFSGTTMSNTHEWCAPHIEPQLESLQALPLSDFPWSVTRIRQEEVIHVPRVAELPEEAARERQVWGQQGILSVVLVPMMLEGKPLGFIGFGSARELESWRDDDVALLRIASGSVVSALERKRADRERRALEEQLVQARSLENVARLAGGVAHDFNNLLSVILNHARALERHLSEPRLRQYASVLCQSAEQAAELTRQLMVVGRREPVHSEVLDVNQVLRSMAHLLERTLGDEVEFEVSPWEQPCYVKLGRAHLKQILVNLTVNARDALPTRGGRVVIDTLSVDAVPRQGESVAMAGPWIRLGVADTGAGMSAAVASRVFEPFFSTKGDFGTGLGLSTVQGIVSQAGGQIHIDTAIGRGTRVEVYLPQVVSMPCPDVTRAPSTPPPRGRGELILLVEDSEPLRVLIEHLLVEQDYRVMTAAHPALAIELAERAGCDLALLLTDAMLPAMTGRELAERVRQTDARLRVAYMSGHDDQVLLRRGAVDAGILLLHKPFSDRELLAFVRRALDEPAMLLNTSARAPCS